MVDQGRNIIREVGTIFLYGRVVDVDSDSRREFGGFRKQRRRKSNYGKAFRLGKTF